MTTRTVGIGAGWRWLVSAINLGSRNAGAIFGAAALMMVVGLVPSILQAIAQAMIPSPAFMWLITALVVGFWLFVLMPLGAGFYRLIHASESGQAARATSIFEVFGNRSLVLRMAGVGLSLLLLSMIIGLIMSLFLGQDFMANLFAWGQAMETIDQENPVMPPAPDGLGLFVALALLFGLFFTGVSMLAFGQGALGEGKISDALKDGFVGTFRNVLPLVLLFVLCMVLGVVGLMVFLLVAVVLMLVGSLVAPVLGVVLTLPVYLGALLVVYVIAFGVGYFMWRDVCGGQAATPDSGDTLAL